jgi:hypothetical protein
MMAEAFPPRRRLARRAGIALVVCLACLAAAAWRLSWSELRVPDWAVDRIAARIDHGLPGATVAMSGLSFFYDLEAGALRLRLSDAALSRDAVPVLSLPDAQVSFDGRALLSGRLRPRSVVARDLTLASGRNLDGSFTLATPSGGGTLPADASAWLAALDGLLVRPGLRRLDAIRLENLTLELSDAVTGLSERIEGGRLELLRAEGGLRATLDLALPTRRGAATLTAALVRGADGARAAMSITDLPIGRLADLLPQVPALALAQGDLSLEAELTVDARGVAEPLRGRLAVSDAALVDRPRLALDRAALGFVWPLGGDRIEIAELAASSDELALRASGQVLLEAGITGPVQLQLRLSDVLVDPEAVFDRRVEFEDGVIELRLTQAPLAMRLGQAMLTGPSGTARLQGRVTFGPGGPDGHLRLRIPRMDVADVAALWPRDLQVPARQWFRNNLLDGTAVDAVAALRLSPGAPPEALASLSFEDATFRYMRTMPPAEGAAGAVQLDGSRLSVRVDHAQVPALAPGDGRDEANGLIDIAGSRVVLPDLSARPPPVEVHLEARGRIEDTLALLDNPPFRLLDRLSQPRDFVFGQAEATVSVFLPLRPGNAPSDIDYRVAATLLEAQSDRIVPGRRIAGTDLALTMTPAAVEIAGDVLFEGIPFSGSWRQPLPPRPTDPPGDAASGAPMPAPEPGRVVGTALVTPEALDRLGVSVGALELSGSAAARVEIALPRGGPPALTATSDLRGLAAALPVIDWRLGRDREAQFAVAATLGPTPAVQSLSIDAPGLLASGRISLEGGALDVARFDRVRLPWFDGAVTLQGRGRGTAPGIVVPNGRANLAEAPFGGGGGGGDDAPIRLALSGLRVTEGIVLTDLTATLRGGAGRFAARINGGAAVEGVLAPRDGGTVVQVLGTDAGGVLRSAGLFRNAAGGRLDLRLQTGATRGTYDGTLAIEEVRVRDAPAIASLLQTLSVVGILEQLTGEGLFFENVNGAFTIRPGDVILRRASAVGPSMSITADGVVDTRTDRLDLQGVISPIYLVNGLFGALFAPRDEGLFGFTYRMRGAVDDPQVEVNPLSILTPGAFRDIFRRPPPT